MLYTREINQLSLACVCGMGLLGFLTLLLTFFCVYCRESERASLLIVGMDGFVVTF